MASFAEDDLSLSLIQSNGKGWNSKLAVDRNKIPELMCKSCNHICRDAVELSCDHNEEEDILFCESCLTQILRQNNNICPIDGSHKDTKFQAVRTTRRYVLKLKVVIYMYIF